MYWKSAKKLCLKAWDVKTTTNQYYDTNYVQKVWA